MTQHRSHEIEAARTQELLRRFKPQDLETVVQRAAKEVLRSGDIWKGGVEPMPFDQFCHTLDEQALWPRQVVPFEAASLLRASSLLDPTRTKTEGCFVWGKRCLAGETLIRCYKRKETKTIREWAEIGCPLRLKTTDGEFTFTADASPAFLKGIDIIYRVTLDYGLSFRATAGHIVRTKEGWTYVGALTLSQEDGLVSEVQIHEDRWSWRKVISIVPEDHEGFYDLTVPTWGCYFDASGILHHNSGKDMTIGKLAVYSPYVLSKLRVDPCTLMSQLSGRSIAAGTRLDCPNIAPNADLAIEVFFNYVKGFLSTPLFQDIDIYPRPEKMMPGTDHIIFEGINLHLYSKSSDASGLDGYNVFRYFIDEGDEFASEGALRLRRIFRRTMMSTFGPFGLGLSFSYPRYEEGYILNLKKEMDQQLAQEGVAPLFFVDFAPTHEVRPDFDINSPEVQHEFQQDPHGAAAMFLCEPMTTDQAFFPYREKIVEAVDPSRRAIVEFRDRIIEVPLDNGTVVRRIGAEVVALRPRHGVATFLGGDGGLKKDSFAIAGWHVEEPGGVAQWLCPQHGQHPTLRQHAPYQPCDAAKPAHTGVRCGICATSPFDYHPLGLLRGWWGVGADSEVQQVQIGSEFVALPKIYQDFLYQFRPVQPTGTQKAVVVDYTSQYGAYSVTARLCRDLKVRQARFDPHNTPSIIQGLQDSSIDADEISFSNPEQLKRALLCRILLNNNRLVMLPDPYADDPWGRDVQWRRLQHKGTQGVDHPVGGAKDLYDADSIAIWCAAMWVQPSLEMLIVNSMGR